MDQTALFKLTYGLFLAGAEYEGKKNACIINTAAQITVSPLRMSVTMLKTNYTSELIIKKESLTISVLSMDTTLDFIGGFGNRSGRTCNKFDSILFETDQFGNPWIKQNMAAYMSLKIEETIDVGTHYLFICEVVEAQSLSSAVPMTYSDYRDLKAGKTPNKTQEKTVLPEKQYVCSVCHYVYDGGIPFEELPDDYLCPICGQPKAVFQAI